MTNKYSRDRGEKFLEQRLLRIEENLGIKKSSNGQKKNVGDIFTNEGAKKYGEAAKAASSGKLKIFIFDRIEKMPPYFCSLNFF